MGYQLKITIKNSHPPIWRRILVPSHITFFDLDDIIEAAFGWQHDHMFAFDFRDVGEEFIGTPIRGEEDTADECIDEWMQEGRSFLYTYDFGDDWVHTVKVEKVIEYDKRYPQVMKSKGPNMIEDCGGIWGFYDCIEEAEPFDMEALNAKFQKWNLKKIYPKRSSRRRKSADIGPDLDEWAIIQDLFSDLLGSDKKSQEEFGEWMQIMQKQEEEMQKSIPPVESLEDIFLCYTKNDLKEIAQMYGLTGYNKFKKKELAQWLKNHLLDTVLMKKVLLEASEASFQLFESAVEKNGISMAQELVERHPLLVTYGGFHQDLEFYQVPDDVKEKYKKICTPQFRQECIARQKFMVYCDAALYLYGVLPIEKFVEIYNSYEDADMKPEEAEDRIWNYIKHGEAYVLKDGFFMEAELEEENMFRYVLQEQEPYSYYIPENKEEFLVYGECGCQEPDESTDFFLNYLQKKLHKKAPEDLMIYYEIQDGIRMNEDVEELISVLLEFDCRISSDKQIKDAMNQILKLGRYIRKWDYKGHTNAEIQKSRDDRISSNRKIVSFPGVKKVYPNDPCPCGSGKKYKHCCGKKQC